MFIYSILLVHMATMANNFTPLEGALSGCALAAMFLLLEKKGKTISMALAHQLWKLTASAEKAQLSRLCCSC